jgi:hypothetical protein
MSEEYKDSLLPDTAEEIVTVDDKTPTPVAEEVEYYELPDSPEARRRGWSVISFFAGILSVLLCPIYVLGFAFAVLAVVGAVVSRKKLGYFDTLALSGMLIGIVGAVFCVFSLVVDITGIFDGIGK